jgi:D-tagatose-1,6-bisphosphate aldolase subunit GatZ/KbaZ
VFALDAIEREWLPAEQCSGVRAALDAAMLREPAHWRGHYGGEARAQAFARAFSLSDRCRYYWTDGAVAAALDRLIASLSMAPIPLSLLSQYLPTQYAAIREGRLSSEPRALILHRIREAARPYAWACGLAPAPMPG